MIMIYFLHFPGIFSSRYLHHTRISVNISLPHSSSHIAVFFLYLSARAGNSIQKTTNSTQFNSICELNWIELKSCLKISESSWIELDFLKRHIELKWTELKVCSKTSELSWIESKKVFEKYWIELKTIRRLYELNRIELKFFSNTTELSWIELKNLF